MYQLILILCASICPSLSCVHPCVPRVFPVCYPCVTRVRARVYLIYTLSCPFHIFAYAKIKVCYFAKHTKVNMPVQLYFKALADETRLRLMLILSRYELSVNELVNLMGMGQSRISRHLKILADAGLLIARRDGLWVFYSLPKSSLGERFWQAILPFLMENPDHINDLALAANIVQERALKSRQFFNAVADDWDEMTNKLMGNFNLPAVILAQIPQCQLAADLGCGTGHMLGWLLEKANNVIGVDGSPRMLDIARQRFADKKDRVSLRIGELEHLPLADNEVDLVNISMVLHHLEKPALALREIYRVLARNGKLVIADLLKHNNERLRTDYGHRWLGFEQSYLLDCLEEFSIENIERHKLDNGLEVIIISAIK